MAKYHKNGTRSFPSSMANRFNARPQSHTGIVHFSEAFLAAKYSVLNIASPFANINLFLMALRKEKFNDSTALAV
jgi:hypothetical protein